MRDSIKHLKIALLRLILKTVFKLWSWKKIDENLVVFADERQSALPQNMLFLYNELTLRKKYRIVCILPRGKSRNAFLRLVNMMRFTMYFAYAKYVVVEDYYYPLYVNKRREGTRVLQLWHACGPFKKFGYQCLENDFGITQALAKKYPIHVNYTHIPVCSPETIPYFCDAFNIKKDIEHVFLPVGVPRTDAFFQEDFVKRAKEKFRGIFPEAGLRKVILYAPTFRGEIEDARFEAKIDVIRFMKTLKRDYVLITKLHPFIRRSLSGDPGTRAFCRDVTGRMGIEEALCVADICITDYSSLIFEYSLFERPMIFYAYDYENYMRHRGTYYDYESFIPGKMVRTETELLSAIENLQSWFKQEKVKAFKEKYMRCCDGKSTARIADIFFPQDVFTLK